VIDARVTLEAKRLLTETEQPIAVLADRLGFGEPTNFARFFARNTGHTPATFRMIQRLPPA
jgi:AraC-like DNA-binding protein